MHTKKKADTPQPTATAGGSSRAAGGSGSFFSDSAAKPKFKPQDDFEGLRGYNLEGLLPYVSFSQISVDSRGPLPFGLIGMDESLPAVQEQRLKYQKACEEWRSLPLDHRKWLIAQYELKVARELEKFRAARAARASKPWPDDCIEIVFNPDS